MFETAKKIEKGIQKRIIAAIERVRIRPESFAKRLVGEPYYKLRVGNYRVITDIYKTKILIMVLFAGHRKKTYKDYRR